MSIMVILQIVVLLGAIFIGVRLGGIGIGYAGGAGVLVLGLCLGMKPGNIPWDVILIIASVIAAISASIYKAVVNQTIAGLAQGRPIKGQYPVSGRAADLQQRAAQEL